MVVFGGAGGRTNEGRVNVDGISVGSAFNGAGVSSYIADVGNAREVTMTTSGGLGEAEGGGPSLNMLPKEGGNTVRGSFFAAGVTEGMVGSNYTRGAARSRSDDAWRDAQGLGFQPRRRRPDRAGPPVVLRHAPRRRQRAHGAGHVRQRQRRRSDEVDVRRRHEPPGRARGLVSHDRAAADRAGDAAQQVHGVLGRAAAVRRRRRAGLLGRAPAARRATTRSSPDRRPRRRRRRPRRSRRRRRRTATTATACRRRSGRRR